ncbi:hypothetical protein OGAPHI_001745 [Ogataea philodendri]|uniref:Uncharacterized protein n=1 Tax=Ogataea philodendri TaxID=1378263 RepID=A0A9P8PA61_9ASCO|nr:uncharacterized protein OGAPHI_001745 [Ogataea philodendri]KAH3667991.1 hypothetical protein OGAPHI_001745 [Ogataea philodendri]
MTRTQHHKSHTESCSLAGNCRVGVQDGLELFVDSLVSKSHGSDSETKTGTVQNDVCVLVVCRVAIVNHNLAQIICHLTTMTGIDETQSKQRSTVGVCGRSASWQVWLQHRTTLRQISLVDHTQSCSGGELGPVIGLPEPLKVGSKERVVSGSHVHEGILESHCRVENGVSSIQHFFRRVENRKIGVVIVGQERDVKVAGWHARKDSSKLDDVFVLLVQGWVSVENLGCLCEQLLGGHADEVECYLESNEHFLARFEQILENPVHQLEVVQLDNDFGDDCVVWVGQRNKTQDQRVQDLGPEIDVVGHCGAAGENVAYEIHDELVVLALADQVIEDGLDDVQSITLEGNSKRELVLAF